MIPTTRPTHLWLLIGSQYIEPVAHSNGHQTSDLGPRGHVAIQRLRVQPTPVQGLQVQDMQRVTRQA